MGRNGSRSTSPQMLRLINQASVVQTVYDLRWGDGLSTKETDARQTLSPRQELVLLLRFGLGGRPTTHQRVAETLGLSPRTVRRIENEALRRLRLSTLDSIGSGQCDWDEA